jgi:hypothetical protein
MPADTRVRSWLNHPKANRPNQPALEERMPTAGLGLESGGRDEPAAQGFGTVMHPPLAVDAFDVVVDGV